MLPYSLLSDVWGISALFFQTIVSLISFFQATPQRTVNMLQHIHTTLLWSGCPSAEPCAGSTLCSKAAANRFFRINCESWVMLLRYINYFTSVRFQNSAVNKNTCCLHYRNTPTVPSFLKKCRTKKYYFVVTGGQLIFNGTFYWLG